MHSLDTHNAGDPWEQPALEETSYVEKALSLVLLLVLTVGCLFVLRPFLTAIFLAIALCVSTWRIYRKLETRLGDRPTAAALLMTIICACVLVLPLIALASSLAGDVVRLSAAFQSAIERGLPPPEWLVRVPIVGAEANRIWIEISQQGAELGPTLMPYLAPLRDWALHQATSLLSGTLQVCFAIVLAFFLYRDGVHMERRVEWAMSRIGGWRARHALPIAGTTIKSVVIGVLGTALVQGILLGFSFWLSGIPGGVVLGAMGVLLALIPFGLVALWLPAAVWLMSEGHTGWAIFVMAWNGLLVGNVDNVLRPYLISRGINLPMVLIALGVLGGLISFGIVGIFLGPVLLAVVYSLIRDWGDPRTADPELYEAGRS